MPVADAPWWNPDSPQDGKPLRRNAPTLNQYHHPDQRQLERMRSGIGTPLIIPKATSDGASPAFNAHEPGVVHVDPDAPDGGAIVDLTHLNRNQMRKALSQSSFPHQVYYQLGVSPSLIGGGFNRVVESREPDRQNSLLPNDYVVPKAAQDGGQSGYYQQTPGFGPVAPTVVNGYTPPLPNPAYQVAQETHSMLPPMPQFPGNPPQPQGPAPAPQQQPQYQPQPQSQPQYPQAQPQPYYPPQPQYAPPPQYPAPMGPDPNMMAMMAQMQQALTGLAGKVAEIGSAPQRQNFPPVPSATVAARRVTRPVEDNPYAQDARTNTFDDSAMKPIPRGQQAQEEGVGEYEQRRQQRAEQVPQRQTLDDLREEPRDGIIVGFESLKLPYVIGPKGLKPRRQVFFELPGVGNHAVRYHDVVVAKNSLTLIYDTRYEDGDMYVPPELGEAEIRVHVPHLKKTFMVSSVGLTFPMGVFDQVVLPMHSQEALDLEKGD